MGVELWRYEESKSSRSGLQTGLTNRNMEREKENEIGRDTCVAEQGTQREKEIDKRRGKGRI